MASNTWSSPITIENPETGVRRTVRTVRQAKAILDRRWSDYHGSQYDRAEKVCDLVLNGDAAPAKARQAFIAAAIEAHLRLS
ncbi:MAG: hypothetical protein JWM58_2729 [Rhizobium sp.]|nr:hypothetical protein [Rhizobium sp.]